MHPSRSRKLAYLSVLAALACALAYVVALGTGSGLDADATAVPGGTAEHAGAHTHTFLQTAFERVSNATIVLAAVALLLVAVCRKRPYLVAASIGTLLCANATAYLLKPLLAHADPLGGEAVRGLDASFPSGHATAAMSLALVAVIVAPPRWRARVALAAAAYAACIGVGLVAVAYHYPSDVVGGYLVATAWAAALTAIALARRDHRPAPSAATPSPVPSPAGIVAATAAAIVVGLLMLVPATRYDNGVFAVVALGIAWVALLLPVGLTSVLVRGRPGGLLRASRSG